MKYKIILAFILVIIAGCAIVKVNTGETKEKVCVITTCSSGITENKKQ